MNQLTGFDLLMLISKEKVRIDMIGEEVIISVADGLPELITKATGVEVSRETIQNLYVEFAKLLGGINITVESKDENASN